jgi:hypothetical protein
VLAFGYTLPTIVVTFSFDPSEADVELEASCDILECSSGFFWLKKTNKPSKSMGLA